MSANYFAIPTNVGQAKIANAIALGVPLKITAMGVGDGGGQPVTPDPAMTALPGEQRRAPINTLFQDPLNPSQLVAEQILPEDVGGWWVRCVGLYDESGTLIAIANAPDTYKPLLTSGSGRTQTIRIVLIVSNTSAVELKIDPAVVLATRKYIDDAIKAHKESREHPDASETAKGFTRYATLGQTEAGTADDVAVTPKRLRAGFAVSLADNGYIAFPTWMGGLIIQWGGTTTNTSSDTPITFPIAFPNAFRQAIISANQAGTPVFANYSGVSNAGINVAAYVSNTGVRTASVVSYWAIGY
ncbi:phage tail protein [Aeromonas rivipollensis]|uniref:phage tail protein n=1 Tax=Aeromonas rivipollensis TaxID=948519 RepID=UPI00259FC52A|nr:phage tail protein [Aeromonas rivipollensis]MDM5094377.1 phage tail protein [Aeromonas rivipollensis]